MFGAGKILVTFGLLMVLSGLFFMLAGKIPFLGKLPGDIEIHRKGLDIYFPIATCLVVSLLLTVILNIFFRHKQ
ncbi:MAG: DUF2905 domain-containing protein [Candidatus Omnitrophica bacterium]|nr:DUF2905 domain-containing protein [Candidatus Omnitrophota bacterium]